MVGAAAPAVAQDGRLTPDQQREFLQKARIVDSRPIGRGVTGSLRLTLDDGTLTHDAAFQSVDMRMSDEDRRQGRTRAGERNFVDSYKFNIAAYDLSRLFAVDDMMPVTVERRYQGRTGSLTWWLDDVLMDEAERDKSNVQPPRPLAFQRERMRMAVFAELVGDVDRNQGNIIYTKDWRVIMIDFTRAFRLHTAPLHPHTLTTVERRLWDRLQKATDEEIRRAAGANLTRPELNALLARRTAIAEHYARLISMRGEALVVY